MRNMFTCYGFALIMKEQFRDPKAGNCCREVFVEYGKSFTQKWLDFAIEKGMVKPFDTNIVAKIFTHCVLININLKVQETTVPGLKFDITSTFDGLKRFILDAVEVEREK